MPNTIVVGDSTALGIGQAIPRSMIVTAENLGIAQMQSSFNSAIATAQQGDTVILGAGYNSTGPNGLSTEDVASVQTFVNAVHAKGARVVIAPLRETGMTGDYARLNGQTTRTNTQLRGITNATFAEQALATVNAIPGGEIHGAYPDVARLAVAAASTPATPATGASASAEADRAQESRNNSGGGIMAMIQRFITWISELFSSIFGGSSTEQASASTGTTPNGGTGNAQPTPDANRERTLADASGVRNGTVTGGADVDDAPPPRGLPIANGQRVTAVG